MTENNNKNNNTPTTPTCPTDPASKAAPLGEHPVGVGIGAIGAGAAAGAVGGAVGGPIGAVAGAAIGAVVGGLAGKAAADAINPTVETKYWRETHASKSYALTAMSYDDYAPAYQYGWESYDRNRAGGSSFDGVERELQAGWDKVKGTSRLGWDQAKHASREAWNRVRNGVHTAAKATTTL